MDRVKAEKKSVQEVVPKSPRSPKPRQQESSLQSSPRQRPRPKEVRLSASGQAPKDPPTYGKIVIATPNERSLMRQVSGLGMEDPIFDSQNQAAAAAVKKVSEKNILSDMLQQDMPTDMQSLYSVQSDPTANLGQGDGVDQAKFHQSLSFDVADKERPSWLPPPIENLELSISDLQIESVPAAATRTKLSSSQQLLYTSVGRLEKSQINNNNSFLSDFPTPLHSNNTKQLRVRNSTSRTSSPRKSKRDGIPQEFHASFESLPSLDLEEAFSGSKSNFNYTDASGPEVRRGSKGSTYENTPTSTQNSRSTIRSFNTSPRGSSSAYSNHRTSNANNDSATQRSNNTNNNNYASSFHNSVESLNSDALVRDAAMCLKQQSGSKESKKLVLQALESSQRTELLKKSAQKAQTTARLHQSMSHFTTSANKAIKSNPLLHQLHNSTSSFPTVRLPARKSPARKVQAFQQAHKSRALPSLEAIFSVQDANPTRQHDGNNVVYTKAAAVTVTGASTSHSNSITDQPPPVTSNAVGAGGRLLVDHRIKLDIETEKHRVLLSRRSSSAADEEPSSGTTIETNNSSEPPSPAKTRKPRLLRVKIVKD
jgi:hypothetical protein